MYSTSCVLPKGRRKSLEKCAWIFPTPMPVFYTTHPPAQIHFSRQVYRAPSRMQALCARVTMNARTNQIHYQPMKYNGKCHKMERWGAGEIWTALTRISSPLPTWQRTMHKYDAIFADKCAPELVNNTAAWGKHERNRLGGSQHIQQCEQKRTAP